MINYFSMYSEKFREWLAYKIFPELDLYTTAIKRLAEIDENDRCVKALQDADSTCSDWAVDVIKIKFVSVFWDEMSKNLKEQGYDEPPF